MISTLVFNTLFQVNNRYEVLYASGKKIGHIRVVQIIPVLGVYSNVWAIKIFLTTLCRDLS